VSEDGITEFGLMEANLRSLERSSRCRVINTFICPDTKVGHQILPFVL
jgi:hypothetical protein